MPSRILEPGSRLGKYEVLAHIATGGMGDVYKARDVELRRIVALKVLPPQLAQRPAILERFRREARSAARLSHKNIVSLFDAGQEEDLYYLALEFVEGVDLGLYIERKGRLSGEETRRILAQAARALDHAYCQGIIHRDIKPSNFLLSIEKGRLRVRLTDLGLALTEHDDEFKVTRDGSTVGTVDYMAPEQARDSRSADIRSDLYALGCTAYHMLSGRPPFAEGGLGERIYKHMESAPEDVRRVNPQVSEGLWTIVERLLAKLPEERYQTPAELLHDLRRTPGQGRPAPAAAPPARTTQTKPSPPTPPEPASAETEAAPIRSPSTEQSPTPPPVLPSEEEPETSGVSRDQSRAAANQFERARQVMQEGGGDDYACQLLLSCLKLDPFNTLYRKTLRQVHQRRKSGLLGRWMGSLNVLAIKARLRAARSSGDHRKVLEQGEEVLARQPADVQTHLDMAEAAEQLGQLRLAGWLLEQGCDLAPENVPLMRALAHVYEERKDLTRAIALWEQVRKVDPTDVEIVHKINALSVKDHISRSNYRR
jgi:serine/threonine protein kinase